MIWSLIVGIVMLVAGGWFYFTLPDNRSPEESRKGLNYFSPNSQFRYFLTPRGASLMCLVMGFMLIILYTQSALTGPVPQAVG